MSRILLALSLVTLISCGLNSPTGVELRQDAGIIGGTLVSEKAPIASGIVSVYDVKDNFICTGSLIAENFVLTAAHCSMTRAQNVRIVFGLDVDAVMAIREPDIRQMYVRDVARITVHPSYNPNDETKEFDLADIAIMKFNGALPPGFKPATMLPDNSLLKIGASVTLAGYGVSEVDVQPVDPKRVKNLPQALEYGEVMCDENLRNCVKIEMSGDGVLRETKAPISFLYETEVRLDESKGHGTCSGDSGGPAYLEKDGQHFLFGITSRGSAACDEVGIYTNAVYYKDWIAATLSKMK